MSEVPDQCKYVKTCSRPVRKDHFEWVCITTDWVDCEWIRPDDIREYKKTPREWLEKVGDKK